MHTSPGFPLIFFSTFLAGFGGQTKEFISSTVGTALIAIALVILLVGLTRLWKEPANYRRSSW